MAVKSHDPKDYGDPIAYDPDFHGPLKRRSCTDVLCLFLFLAFIGCWIGIGLYAFVKGDPKVFLVPKDSQGSRCGLDSHVLDKPYLFFFDLTKCLQPIPFTGCKTPQVCVAKCPDKAFLFDVGTNNVNDMICQRGIIPNRYDLQKFVADGTCARWYLPSVPVQRRCLPNIFTPNDLARLKAAGENVTGEIIDQAKSVINSFADWEQVGNNIVDDIVKTWKYILVGLVMALVVCIIYIILMRWIAGVMVWLSIVGVLAALSVGIYFCVKTYQDYKKNPPNYANKEWYESLLYKHETWLAFTIILSIALAIIVLMLIFLRKRILLAIALIKEASRAVGSITAALFFPIFPWVIQIGVIIYAVSVGLYLSSVGTSQFVVNNLDPKTCVCTGDAQNYVTNSSCDPDVFSSNCRNSYNGQQCPDASCQFIGVDTSKIITYLHVFNVFGFFWGLFFVAGLADMILAATFATWYWTFRKKDVPFFIVTNSTMRTFRFHLGTVAFGALIIAICTMIRVMLEYIDSKLKKYENPVTKAIMCCCKCFFWCLEKFIKFINRNAYIMCAIHGRNFCMSAKDAFNLLMRNILRVFVLDKVTDFLLFLSKLLVTVGITAVAFVMFSPDFLNIVNENGVNYYYVPVIILGVSTFFISLVFFSVFTMAVDTLFLCFLEDSERNDGSPEKPYFMSKNLMQILGKKNV